MDNETVIKELWNVVELKATTHIPGRALNMSNISLHSYWSHELEAMVIRLRYNLLEKVHSTEEDRVTLVVPKVTWWRCVLKAIWPWYEMPTMDVTTKRIINKHVTWRDDINIDKKQSMELGSI